MSYYHKMINNIFGSDIYHKHHSILKSEFEEFHNGNIGILSKNENIIAGYFTEMHKDLQTRKILQDNILSA